MSITGNEAFKASKALAREEADFGWYFFGCAFSGSSEARKSGPENQDKIIVVLLPDAGDRYLSTDLFK